MEWSGIGLLIILTNSFSFLHFRYQNGPNYLLLYVQWAWISSFFFTLSLALYKEAIMYSAGTLATLRVASHESWRGVMLFFHRVTCFYTTATSKWVNGTEAIWIQSPKVLLSSPKLISKDSNRKGKSCNVRINIFDSLKKKKAQRWLLLETKVPVIAFFFQAWLSSKCRENNSNISASVLFSLREGNLMILEDIHTQCYCSISTAVFIILRPNIGGILLLIKDSK